MRKPKCPFTINQSQTRPGDWYIVAEDVNYYDTLFFPCLHKDLEIHMGTAHSGLYDDPDAGFYKSADEAERYLRAYEVSQMRFIVRQCRHWPERGWYIITDTGARYRGERFVWRDLELHGTTGFEEICGKYGVAPGYYVNEYQAKIHLHYFKEKHNMTQDKLVINVKVNGIDTPLHEISEQTLLRIREASKPKPVPVFQVCDFWAGNRLIIKLPKDKDFGKYSDKYVSLWLNTDGKACIGDSDSDIGRMVRNCSYKNIRELRLNEV